MPHERPSKGCQTNLTMAQPVRRCAMALAAAMADSVQNLFPQSLPWMHGKHLWAGLRPGQRFGRAGAPGPGSCMHAMQSHGDPPLRDGSSGGHGQFAAKPLSPISSMDAWEASMGRVEAGAAFRSRRSTRTRRLHAHHAKSWRSPAATSIALAAGDRHGHSKALDLAYYY